MIPAGFCQCGCGERTPIAAKTRAQTGQRKGEPMRFIHNHHRRGVHKPQRWRIEDRGYKTPCRIWQLATNSNGYGAVWHDGRMRSVHVVEWERVHGPVPDGLELDHLCHQRACGEPEHLQPVTHAENLRRARNC